MTVAGEAVVRGVAVVDAFPPTDAAVVIAAVTILDRFAVVDDRLLLTVSVVVAVVVLITVRVVVVEVTVDVAVGRTHSG